jgi:hypothetical protein
MKTLLFILALALLLCPPFTLSAEPVPAPGIELSTEGGCSPCTTGDRAVFTLHVVNPGAERGVQIVALLRHPTGAVYPMRHHGKVVLIAAGASALVLADFSVPGGTAGVFLIEAALVDPASSVTLARDVLGVARD